MYSLLLFLCITAVVLSPVVFDLLLSFREARERRRAHLFAQKKVAQKKGAQKKGAQFVYAPPRAR